MYTVMVANFGNINTDNSKKIEYISYPYSFSFSDIIFLLW